MRSHFTKIHYRAMARKNYISVRLSDAELLLFQSLAAKEGIPLADWMRDAGKVYGAFLKMVDMVNVERANVSRETKG